MRYQLLLAYVLFVSSASADLLVDLPDGTILGSEITEGNFSYYAYQGIPFAKPPLGQLRFQYPVPNDPWDGVLNATQIKSCCLASSLSLDPQSEDCLYVSVFTPARNITEKLPVMFWIYGGGLKEGCGTSPSYDPWPLLREDVIVVKFNYRVGVYGFLSTQDNVILGNAGLKDQLLAMKWTQKNIEYFGGDPDKVTIFGQSAGGISVGAHVANNKSAGLYRAAICQSGCSLTNLSQTIQTNPRQSAVKIAKTLNPFISDSISSEDLRDFLQSQSSDALSLAFSLANPESGIVVEVEDENAYVTDVSYGLIESGNFNQVPLLIGTTSAEALTFLFALPVAYIAALGLDLGPTLLIPTDLNPLPATDKNALAGIIKKAYTDKPFVADLPAVVEFISDTLFVRSSLKQAELQSKYSPVYFYQFSYSGALSWLHTMIEGTGKVGHAEDVAYLFDIAQFPLNSDDFLTRDRMTRLWTNFAKTLNPTPDESDPLLNVTWPLVSGTNIPYLDIDETLEVKPGKKAKQMAMWDDVFYNYGQEPLSGF